MRSLEQIVRDNGGDNTPMLDTHNLTGRASQCWMVLNGWDDGHLEESECRALRGYEVCAVHGGPSGPPVNPDKLTGPEVGTLCVYNTGYALSPYPRLNGRVVRVLERSYVWAPGDRSYRGGVRRYDWSVVEYGAGKTLCVDDSDLTPLEVGAIVQMNPNDPFYPTGTDW